MKFGISISIHKLTERLKTDRKTDGRTDMHNHGHSKDVAGKDEGDSELRNAFRVLMESRKGASPSSLTPRRKYIRRKIGDLKSPLIDGTRNGTIRDWIKRKEKANLKFGNV